VGHHPSVLLGGKRRGGEQDERGREQANGHTILRVAEWDSGFQAFSIEERRRPGTGSVTLGTASTHHLA
jgi:hypothetical protein